jgi:hypothetical protein
MGSRVPCWLCQGTGSYIDDAGYTVRCDVVGCESGYVSFPVTSRTALADRYNGCFSDSWECISHLTDGRCDHCSDRAAEEYGWMERVPSEYRRIMAGLPAYDDLSW